VVNDVVVTGGRVTDSAALVATEEERVEQLNEVDPSMADAEQCLRGDEDAAGEDNDDSADASAPLAPFPGIGLVIGRRDRSSSARVLVQVF
jgi:hypothetical protein